MTSAILFDSAYAAYITEDDALLIYEIEGARDVAIEFRSFSKTAGFTGTRCGYTVIPKTVTGKAADGSRHEFNKLWNRRHTTKFNGTAYIVQRGAEAVYLPKASSRSRSWLPTIWKMPASSVRVSRQPASKPLAA